MRKGAFWSIPLVGVLAISCNTKTNSNSSEEGKRIPVTAIPRDSNFLQQKLPEQVGVGLPQDVLNRRPDVLQAEAELKATKADVGAAKAALLPALTLSPFLGYSSFNSRLLLNPASIAYGIIGGATAPLVNRSA